MDDKAAERFWAKVDLLRGDGCWLWTAGVDGRGYGQFKLNGKSYSAHRLTMQGNLNGWQVDHICHVKRCVNPMHLRLVSNKQNRENHKGANRNNRSGIQGAAWVSSKSKWRARVGHNCRKVHVGYFDTAEEAGEAARLKRLELFTHNDADRVS